jgi:hypothetical protein
MRKTHLAKVALETGDNQKPFVFHYHKIMLKNSLYILKAQPDF